MNSLYDFIDLYGLKVKNISIDKEGNEYLASQFMIDGALIFFRTAKVTPKKVGLFVTFWKRNLNGKTNPFSFMDEFSDLMVFCKSEEKCGYFQFPKSSLIAMGILESEDKKGKLGFRVYPPWSIPENNQAKISQKWQLEYWK